MDKLSVNRIIRNISIEGKILDKFSLILFVIFTCAPNLLNQAASQDFELAGLVSEFYPQDIPSNGNNVNQLAFHEYGAFSLYPYLHKNDKTILLNGFAYWHIDINGSGSGALGNFNYSERFKIIQYQFWLTHQISDEWKFVFHLRPSIAKDAGRKVTYDDYVIQSVAFASKQINRVFAIGGGYGQTMSFGKPFFIPLLTLDYAKGKHSFTSVLPLQAKYNYAVDKKGNFNIGLKELASGLRYNLSKSYANVYGTENLDKVSFMRINIGAFTNYRINPFLSIEVQGGSSVLREYRILDVTGKKHKLEFVNTPFIRFSLVVVPPK